MSEFKWTDELVKEFILSECNKYGTWDSEGINIWFDKFKASKQPKPGWEILSYIVKDIDGIGKLDVIDKNNEWFKVAIVCKNPIYSVKRLSDGEVFTVGDRVGYGFDGTPNQFFIDSFHIYDKWMAVRGGGVEAVDITLLNRSAGDVCPLTPNEIKQLRKILYCK